MKQTKTTTTATAATTTAAAASTTTSWADMVKKHMPSDAEKKALREQEAKAKIQQRWTERERAVMRETRLADHSHTNNDSEEDDDDMVHF